MIEESDVCIKCPGCGCDEYTNENSVGEGYRVCADCFQEWWTDIDYDNVTGESDVG